MANQTARLAVFIAVLATVTTPLVATAGIYRWVDESGVTVYSQWPAPTADTLPIQAPAGPSAEEQAAAEERLQQQLERLQDAADERKAAAEARAQTAALQEQRASNCTAARTNLETLQSLGPRMVRKADGSYVRMTEEEVTEAIGTARQQIDEYCQ